MSEASPRYYLTGILVVIAGAYLALSLASARMDLITDFSSRPPLVLKSDLAAAAAAPAAAAAAAGDVNANADIRLTGTMKIPAESQWTSSPLAVFVRTEVDSGPESYSFQSEFNGSALDSGTAELTVDTSGFAFTWNNYRYQLLGDFPDGLTDGELSLELELKSPVLQSTEFELVIIPGFFAQLLVILFYSSMVGVGSLLLGGMIIYITWRRRRMEAELEQQAENLINSAGASARLLLIIMMILGLVFSGPAFAWELSSRLEWWLEGSAASNLSRFSFSDYAENSFRQLAIKTGFDSNGNYSSLDRALLDYYQSKWTFRVGRQRIFWGVPQLLNQADIFRSTDIRYPGREKNGVDALLVRYNPGSLSRVELALIRSPGSNRSQTPEFRNGQIDGVIGRCSFTKGRFEYFFNYLQYQREQQFSLALAELAGLPGLSALPGLPGLPPVLKLNNREFQRDYLLEFRGEIGVGLWGQLAHQRIVNRRLSWNLPPLPGGTGPDIIKSRLNPRTETTLLLGLDYTFIVGGGSDLAYGGRNLYLASEFSRSDNSGARARFHQARLDLTEFSFLTGMILWERLSNLRFYQTGYDYIVDDYTTVGIDFRYQKFRNLTSVVDAAAITAAAAGTAAETDKTVVLRLTTHF